MKKKMMLGLCILSVLILLGCHRLETQEMDAVPQNKLTPITGLWRVNDYLGDLSSAKAMDSFALEIGDACLFREEAVYVGGKYLRNPHFSVRNVPTDAYLIKTYRTSISPSVMPTDRVEVVTISTKAGDAFAELVRVSPKRVLLAVDQGFYLLEQEQPQVSSVELERFIKTEDAINRELITRRQRNVRTGLLLATKRLEEDGSFTYDTYYLPMVNGKPQKVYRTPSILFPRKSGFWEIEVSQRPGTLTPLFSFFAVEKEGEEAILHRKQDAVTLPRGELLFVGADFISFRYQEEGRNVERIFAIDHISTKASLRLDDLIEGGKKKYILAEQNALQGVAPALGDDTGLFIQRDKGYWMINGSRDIVDKTGNVRHMEFPIHVAMPQSVVPYDQNILPWSEMQWILPNLQDAFYSPNQECLVALTTNELLIYRVNDRKMNTDPLFSMPMEDGMTVVMAHWSTDDFVERWAQLMESRGEVYWEEGD